MYKLRETSAGRNFPMRRASFSSLMRKSSTTVILNRKRGWLRR
jgi:hypothetical protein